MTIRTCTTADGTEWTCAQAYAGLGDETDASEAAGDGERVTVVATPSGGAQTVRLQLDSDWHEALSDEQLAEAVKQQSA